MPTSLFSTEFRAHGNLVDQAIGQKMVHVARRTEHFQRHAMGLRQLRQRIHVRFRKHAAHAGSGLKATGSNLLVEAQRQRQIHGVRIHALAERGHFVDEGNFRRDESRRSFAHQFRRRLVGHNHRNPAHHQGMKNLLEHLYGFIRSSIPESAGRAS